MKIDQNMNSDILEKTIQNMEKGGRRTLEQTIPQWLIDCEKWECKKCVKKMRKQLADKNALSLISEED